MLLLPLCGVVEWLAAERPEWADDYGRLVYPIVARGLGTLTGWFSISAAEILLFAFVAVALWSLGRDAFRAWRRTRSVMNILAHSAVNTLALLGVLYAGFLSWGLNYHRTPLSPRAGLSLAPATAEEILSLCEGLLEETNALREEVREDTRRTMMLSEPRRHTLHRASLGLERVESDYRRLAEGYAGTVKAPRVISILLSRLGADGIFVMLTGEPSVNAKLPAAAMPFSACHELAHQIGWAREDEASFVGYLACVSHPDPDFRYSGKFAALRYGLSALNRADPERYRETVKKLSPGVRRDWRALQAFRRRYRSAATAVSETAYDLYLKAQGQKAGMASYGKVVDLLVARERLRSERHPPSKPRDAPPSAPALSGDGVR